LSIVTLRAAAPGEAAALTELCLRSKAVWGYDEAFMQACRDELALTPDIIRSSRVQVAELGARVIGIAQVSVHGKTADLTRLFVEPSDLRAGIGRLLFEWATTTARIAGAAALVIEADPDAVGFYRRMGALDDGTVASGSIPGRRIPRLRLQL
jgi:GNAT superfamily N-acetyltransferase